MNKITLDEVESGYKVSTINANFQEIQRILNDQVLFRQTTEPNSMAQPIDANNYPVINVRTPRLNKEAANKLYVDAAIEQALSGVEGETVDFQLLIERVGDAEAAITSEASVRASEDSAMATVLDQLNASVGQVSADIVSETTARATADSSMASSITTLQSRVGTNEAAIDSEVTTRTTQYGALASSISTISANVASNTSAITSEATARTSAYSALASQISTVSANVAANTASIASEATARVSEDSALSSQITTVSSDLGILSSSVSTQMSTVNSRLGVAEAKYTLKLDVNGYVSGFESIAGANSSSFIVKADVFKITMPGYGDYVPFSVGPTNLAFDGFTSWDNVQGSAKPANNATVGATIGTNLFGTFNSTNIGVFMPNAAIGSAQILDAAITSAKIGIAEVGSLNIAGNAVTVPQVTELAVKNVDGGNVTTLTSTQTLATFSTDVNGQGKILLQFNPELTIVGQLDPYAANDTLNYMTVIIRIKRNSTVIREYVQQNNVYLVRTTGTKWVGAITDVVDPGTTVTYTAEVYTQSGIPIRHVHSYGETAVVGVEFKK